MAQGIVNIVREFLFGPKEDKICQSCESLREQLSFANYDRKILMENFIKVAMPKGETTPAEDLEELEPIRNQKFVPWRVRQQELEKASRERAQVLKPEPKQDAPRTVSPESIEKLETELGVNNVRETVREGA